MSPNFADKESTMAQAAEPEYEAPDDTDHDGQDDEEEKAAVALPLSVWAILGVIFGLIALATAAYLGIAAIIALVCAYAGRHEIKNGLKSGAGWASTGLWLGWGALALSFVIQVLLQL